MAINLDELINNLQKEEGLYEEQEQSQEKNSQEEKEMESHRLAEQDKEGQSQTQEQSQEQNQEQNQEQEQEESQQEESQQETEEEIDGFKKLLQTKLDELKNEGEISEEEKKEINEFFEKNKTFKKAIDKLIKDTSVNVLLKFAEEYDKYSNQFLNSVVENSVKYEIEAVKEKYSDFDNYIEDIEKVLNDSEKNLSLEEAYLIAKYKKPISIAENKDSLKTDELRENEKTKTEDTKKYIEDVFPVKDLGIEI